MKTTKLQSVSTSKAALIAHSSVLFRLTYLSLLRYHISGKTMFIEVKLLLFYYVINRNWTTSENIAAHHAIIDPIDQQRKPAFDCCLFLLPVQQ